MTSSYTTNKNIEKPGNNDYINNWNVPVNFDMDIIDAALGSSVTKSSTGLDITLTVTEAQNQRVVVQGALSADISLLIPFVSGSTTQAVGGMWVIDNQTSGAFTVTAMTQVTGSTGVVCPQSHHSLVFSNGTNCYFADDRVTNVVLPQDLAPTSTTTQFASLGVGVAASGTAGVLTTAGAINASGAITSTGNVIAYYSDKRLKEITGQIENALNTVGELTGYRYRQNQKAEDFGYNDYSEQVGLIAQEVQKVLPEAVKIAPFDRTEDGDSVSGENYLTVQYERLVPLLVQAINELHAKVKKLENK